MKRREFITLLGGAAAAWPVVARAQGIERNRRIGVLMASAEADPESRLRVAAFERGLADLGWTTGRNLLIDYRWAAADPALMQTFAGIGWAPARFNSRKYHPRRDSRGSGD